METTVDEIYASIVERSESGLSHGYSAFIGIDGLDCSGKTRFAKGLAEAFGDTDYGVVETIHIDDFNNAEVQQKIYGYLAEGRLTVTRRDEYYEEGIDYKRAAQVLGEKCGDIGEGGVVIVEGVLLRRVLRRSSAFGLTESIYLGVDPEVAEKRFRMRRLEVGDTRPDTSFRELWLPTYERYMEEYEPRQSASLVIDNTDFEHPQVLSQS